MLQPDSPKKMTTLSLLLNRSMGFALPEDYVQWAMERLCEGLDSPSLRILAGLNTRFERDEVEPYFKKSCKELEIEMPASGVEPRKTAELVKRAYDLGDISAEDALRLLAALYQESDYSDPLLAVWYGIEEELSLLGSGHEGYFYPTEALDCLEEVLEREWLLFTRALRLKLPQGFGRFIRCDRCGHIGESRLKHRTLTAKLKAMLPWSRPKPPMWNSCRACGSYHYHSMTDPKVRDAYFNQLESQSRSGDN